MTGKPRDYQLEKLESLIKEFRLQKVRKNKGDQLSGGELSRVMLSLKTILAASDSVGTMIFDEIDTGIGGEVAVSIGSHLKKLAEGRQVLCITHLASIAVYADNQIKISKGVFDGVTKTSAVEIEGEKRVSEIARMLSGDADSAESLEHARSMLEKFS